jgi:hypothetical protein
MSSWKLKEEPSSILKNKFLKGSSDEQENMIKGKSQKDCYKWYQAILHES